MIRTAGDRRTALIEQLDMAGRLPDRAWHAAFAEVPREGFVPWFFVPNRDQPGWRLLEHDDAWLDGVYRDDALVTQLDGDDTIVGRARAGEAVQGVPTSSSSAPSLMAAMLDALHVGPGHRVFEAATGTGYNAALLSHRLGYELVTSVEVDTAVAERARSALHDLGHRPTVIAGDATLGCPDRGPFDRIVSTVAVPAVPPAWLAQTRAGARLVVPLVLAGHSGVMVALDRDDDGAHGRVLAQYGGFMATRSTPLPAPPTIRDAMLDHTRSTDVPAQALGGPHPAAFFLALLTPTFSRLGFTPSDAATGPQTWGHGLDGSTFVHVGTDGRSRVAAHGPLWDDIETAYRTWLRLGRPSRTRLGLTVTPAGEHLLWLDDPAHVLRRLPHG
ncbi:methyltransferase domain-containing protein [Pseudonocardia sp. NPDC046786]|uniref:methyltransferase domain-containing protein n=1 Tax=Pseudonocardia sp. NPDC046786 TaxID=3155471 RepID=UPI0033E95532